MGKETGIIIGSIVFAALGVIAAIVFFVYIGMKSPPQAVSANRKYAWVDVESEWCRFWLEQSVCGSCGFVHICTRWTRSSNLSWLLKKNDHILSYLNKKLNIRTFWSLVSPAAVRTHFLRVATLLIWVELFPSKIQIEFLDQKEDRSTFLHRFFPAWKGQERDAYIFRFLNFEKV